MVNLGNFNNNSNKSDENKDEKSKPKKEKSKDKDKERKSKHDSKEKKESKSHEKNKKIIEEMKLDIEQPFESDLNTPEIRQNISDPILNEEEKDDNIPLSSNNYSPYNPTNYEFNESSFFSKLNNLLNLV